MELTHFEWAFGFDYRGFPFESDHNIVTVPTNLASCLREKTLCLAPSKEVFQQVQEIIKHNNTAEVHERRTFQEFGEGPWEYILFPGWMDRKTFKPKYLPQLYLRSSSGDMSPLHYNTQDYDSLPRITSMIHPTIAIFLFILRPPDLSSAPEILKENIFLPALSTLAIWPAWSHNRFKTLSSSSSSKRKRSDSIASDAVTCKCTQCINCYETASSSTGTYASDIASSDDEVSFGPAGDDEDDKFELNVSAWADKVIPQRRCRIVNFDDLGNDRILQRYAQEPALSPEQVDGALKEENEKRNTLAGPLQKVSCQLSKKRPRRS
ncbi:hypothetical protein VNI00_008092 [Paramarasmius palmivorus]|uniref:Uncharacterized protein n=1 Tax=Paramarasmius palmivorus TaxID=297713 RepID=A0AAW0CXE4_9AGAR